MQFKSFSVLLAATAVTGLAGSIGSAVSCSESDRRRRIAGGVQRAERAGSSN